MAASCRLRAQPTPRASASMGVGSPDGDDSSCSAGGRDAPNAPLWCCDTWTLDGRASPLITAVLAWENRSTACSPAILAGGRCCSSPVPPSAPAPCSGPLASGEGPSVNGQSSTPPGRADATSPTAFDDARGVLVVPVLYAGPEPGTWEWDGTAGDAAPLRTHPLERRTPSRPTRERAAPSGSVGRQALVVRTSTMSGRGTRHPKPTWRARAAHGRQGAPEPISSRTRRTIV
jgi:hypothetical protein